MAGYRLVLTAEDVLTITFVGARYAWSEALLGLPEGVHEFDEAAAWQLAEAFDEDSVGGHTVFPLLSPRSELYAKLVEFRESIV